MDRVTKARENRRGHGITDTHATTNTNGFINTPRETTGEDVSGPTRRIVNTCEDLTELITEYLEGGLGLWGRLSFQVHLGICPSCRAYVRQMRATMRSADSVSPPPMDPEVRDELLERFRTWKSR